METKLTIVQQTALSLLDSIKEIVKTDCNDDELLECMSKYHPQAKKDFINPYDYCTVDRACKILGIGANRNKFYVLARKYKLINYKNPMNNQALGFKVKEIEEVAKLINKKK